MTASSPPKTIENFVSPINSESYTTFSCVCWNGAIEMFEAQRGIKQWKTLWYTKVLFQQELCGPKWFCFNLKFSLFRCTYLRVFWTVHWLIFLILLTGVSFHCAVSLFSRVQNGSVPAGRRSAVLLFLAISLMSCSTSD